MVQHLTNVFLEMIDKHAPLKKQKLNVKHSLSGLTETSKKQLWKEIKLKEIKILHVSKN